MGGLGQTWLDLVFLFLSLPVPGSRAQPHLLLFMAVPAFLSGPGLPQLFLILIPTLTFHHSYCFLWLAPSAVQVWYLEYGPEDISLCFFHLLCSTFGTPSVWLPTAPAHGLSGSSLCYFFSGTFLLDFVMQTYLKQGTCTFLRRDVWHLDTSLGTLVFYLMTYPSHSDQLWVCERFSAYLKSLQNSFYQGGILIYNRWMTIAIGNYYSLCGIQLQISAYPPREHLKAKYHWHEAM